MEVFVALSCYTLYIENRKNLEVVRMNNQRPMFINILLVVLLFLVVGSLFSATAAVVIKKKQVFLFGKPVFFTSFI